MITKEEVKKAQEEWENGVVNIGALVNAPSDNSFQSSLNVNRIGKLISGICFN